METARIPSQWEDAQKNLEQLELRCRRNVCNRCRIWRNYSVGYRAHRWEHIAVYCAEFLRRGRSFFISISSCACSGWRKPCARRTRSIKRVAGELRAVPSAKKKKTAPNNPNNIHTTTRSPGTRKPSSVTTAGGEEREGGGTECKVICKTVVSRKRKMLRELSSRNFRIQQQF